MRNQLAEVASVILLFGCSLLFSQQSPAPQGPAAPLTLADVEHGLKAGVSNTRMATLVKQYGVDFELTDDIEKELRAARATGDLLLEISRAKHPISVSPNLSPNSAQSGNQAFLSDASNPEGGALAAAIPPVNGVRRTAFSLKYQDIQIGIGPDAEPNKMYKVQYTGWRAADGVKFDSTYANTGPLVLGNDGKPKQGDPHPMAFPQGMGRLIPGLDQGFYGMKVGGKRRLFIPWQLAYGTRGRPGPDAAHPGIPSKADLIFDVELVEVSDLPTLPAHPGSALASSAPVNPTPDATPSTDLRCSAPMPTLRNECVTQSNETSREGVLGLQLTNICSDTLRVKVCDGPDGNYDNHGCDAATIRPSKSSRFGLRGRGTFQYWVGSFEDVAGVDNIDPATGGPGKRACSAK